MAKKTKSTGTPTIPGLADAPAKRAPAVLDARDRKTVKKIESMAMEALAEVRLGKNPSLSIPVRALSNVSFDQDAGLIRLGESRQTRNFFHLK